MAVNNQQPGLQVLDAEIWIHGKAGHDTGQPCLSIYGGDWPGAWKIPDGVDKDNFELDYDADADEGFDEFLKAIAPCLAESLTIQSVGTENCRFPISACEWHVRPGAINGFRHSCTEADDCPQSSPQSKEYS